MPTLRLAPAAFLYDYSDGGAYSEVTLGENVSDFHALKMKQRVMRDVSALDTSIELMGETWAMPMALCPTGLGSMMARVRALSGLITLRSIDTKGHDYG